MARISAGLLAYRTDGGDLEVLVAHPGGPHYRHRDDGGWTIPKGLLDSGEAVLTCALREFEEETGMPAGEGPFVPLGEVRQRGGKRVIAFAFEGDFDPAQMCSNTFELEWPPGSGRVETFPEVDRLAWLSPAAARQKLNAAQGAFVDRLIAHRGGTATIDS